MPFLTPIRVEKVPFQNIWILLKDFVYHHEASKYLDLDVTITVPAGFYTDFASIPRLPILYGKLGNRFHEEAVIHDYVYRIDSDPILTQDEADRLLYDMIKEDPFADEMDARLVYDGVHLGGEGSYHKKTVKEVLC